MPTFYVLTGATRTVELECEAIAPFLRSDDGHGTQLEFQGIAYAKCGQALSGVAEAPLLRVDVDNDSASVTTLLGGGASLVVIPGLPPSIPYTLSGTNRAWAKLSLVLEQYQEVNNGYVGERIKPGAHHTLEYELSVYDGTTNNNSATLTQGSTVRLIASLDQGIQASALISASTNDADTITATATAPWAAEYNTYSRSGTSGSSTIDCDIDAAGVATVVCSGPSPASGTVTGHPKLKYLCTIDPHFWRSLYAGSYKIRSFGASMPNGAYPSSVSYSGSAATSYLHGPFSGSSGYSDDQHGGFSHSSIGFAQHHIGNRAGSFTLSMVSATTTNPSSPITHEDHPDGDLFAVRTDQSDGLVISTTGNTQLEDGATLTPTGGEWVNLQPPNGTLSLVGGGGIRMECPSAAYCFFMRGWAVYDIAPLYTKISGDPINSAAYRFIDIAYSTATDTRVTLYLAGLPAYPAGLYALEAPDPGSAGRGSRRWDFTLPAGAGTYRLDLCNPELWEVPAARKDPPYEVVSGGATNSSPEDYEVRDMDQRRGGLVGSFNEGNLSATSQFARMQFQVWNGGDITINGINMIEVGDLCMDMGHDTFRLWGDGKLLAERSLITYNPASGYPSGHNIEALRQYIDQIPGLSATTSLTTGGTEPADWSDRADWEDWHYRSAYPFYYGDLTNTNLGVTGNTVSAELPLLGGHALPGNRAVPIPGYGDTNDLYLRARFGSAFAGLCLREPHALGSGDVEVDGVGTETIGPVGEWGFPGTLACRVDSPRRAVRWVGTGLEQLEMRPGNREVADPMLISQRGYRRFTGFKWTEEIIPKAWTSVDTSPTGITMFATTIGGSLYTAYSKNWSTNEWQERDATITAEQPCIRFLKGSAEGRVAVLYLVSGAAGWIYSDDLGGTWSVPVTVWASGASRVALGSHPAGYQIAAARIGGAIEVKWLDRSGSVIGGPYTALASGAADDAIAVTWDVPAQRWYLMYLSGTGEMMRLESSDGIAWS